jgi:DNA repair protein RadC
MTGMAKRLAAARRCLLQGGARHLTDAELLALLLGRGVEGTDALDVASTLLATSGGLHQLAGRPTATRVPGVGRAGWARFEAAVELGRRCIEGPIDRRRTFRKPADAALCFRARLANLGHEVFCCVFLDTRHRFIAFEAMFRGTIDGAAVYPREIVKLALGLNAAAVILGHNHPSGDCEPSEADRNITQRVSRALALVDIRLLDHLVVSRSGHVSMAERGWL